MAEPIYFLVGVDSTGAAVCRYKCPYCGGTGPRRRPMLMHMGALPDHPHSCPALQKEDDERRAKIKAALKSQR